MVVARVEASTRPPPSIGSGMRLGHVAAFAAALVGALVVATLAVQNHQVSLGGDKRRGWGGGEGLKSAYV